MVRTNAQSERMTPSKLGALLPGTAKASAVVVKYLDRVIDRAQSVRDREESNEKDRQEHTLLGSLIAQGVSRRVSILVIPFSNPSKLR